MFQLFALTLGITWLCTLPALAQITCSHQMIVSREVGGVADSDISGDPKNLVTSPQVILSELAKADVVYLGETHNNPQHHQTQLQIIQKLHQRHPKIAIAMEMFQRPYQGVLNRYLAGQLSEQELLEQSEYKQRWGFPWEYYAPILRFAKENNLPVLALNTPTEVTRKVAREGLESLTPEERRFIPPFSEIRTDNAEYRQLILKAFQQHQSAGHGSSADESRFFLAQVLWDETMAEAIAKFLKFQSPKEIQIKSPAATDKIPHSVTQRVSNLSKNRYNPDYQVVVLAGQGHIVYGYGIPSRVARRINDKQLVQRSVLLSLPEDSLADTNKPIADFIWNSN